MVLGNVERIRINRDFSEGLRMARAKKAPVDVESKFVRSEGVFLYTKGQVRTAFTCFKM